MNKLSTKKIFLKKVVDRLGIVLQTVLHLSHQTAKKMIYREMSIEPKYPNGYTWGTPDDENVLGSAKTIEQCKDEIDTYHLDRVEVTLTLTFEELLAVQLALGIAYKKAPYSYLEKAAKKVTQSIEDVQRDINFERTYTTND